MSTVKLKSIGIDKPIDLKNGGGVCLSLSYYIGPMAAQNKIEVIPNDENYVEGESGWVDIFMAYRRICDVLHENFLLEHITCVEFKEIKSGFIMLNCKRIDSIFQAAKNQEDANKLLELFRQSNIKTTVAHKDIPVRKEFFANAYEAIEVEINIINTILKQIYNGGI